MACRVSMSGRGLLWGLLGMLILLGVGCRAPLRLPDPSAPRCVTFEMAPEVEDPAGLRADLEAAFGPQWRVLPQGSEAPPDQVLLCVRVTQQELGSATSGGNGLLVSGGIILGVGALVLSNASGWDTLAWIPVGGVSIPLLVTGLVQKIKGAVMDSRRGYPLPTFKANLWLVMKGRVNPSSAWIRSQDLRELARPLDESAARDPRQVRRACMQALARLVAEQAGLDSREPLDAQDKRPSP